MRLSCLLRRLRALKNYLRAGVYDVSSPSSGRHLKVEKTYLTLYRAFVGAHLCGAYPRFRLRGGAGSFRRRGGGATGGGGGAQLKAAHRIAPAAASPQPRAAPPPAKRCPANFHARLSR